MRNQPYKSKEKMNQQGILNILLGFIAWLILMFNLNIF